MPVYFIQQGNDGPIKIGIALDIQKRLYGLRQDRHCRDDLKLLGVIQDADYSQERQLHRRFKNIRLEGEWFSPTPELIEFIKNNSIMDTSPSKFSPSFYKCAYCGELFFRKRPTKYFCSEKCRDILKAKRMIANLFDCPTDDVSILVNNESI